MQIERLTPQLGHELAEALVMAGFAELHESVVAEGAETRDVANVLMNDFIRLDAQPAGYVPPPLSRLGTKWVCIAYLHACRLPDGEQRLGVLGIQVFQRGPDGGRVLELYGTGKTPASWQPGSTVQGSAGRKASIPLLPRHRFRLYAGQPNPQDGSRFTMRYELDGRGGTIEGRLAPDGTIDCTVIDGPCTVVSP